jgi:hypothetical protein
MIAQNDSWRALQRGGKRAALTAPNQPAANPT